MIPILSSVVDFFKAEKKTYSHRNRTIEIIALEKGLDIRLLKQEFKVVLAKEGKVEATVKLRRRFHVPLSCAWRFIEKLEIK